MGLYARLVPEPYALNSLIAEGFLFTSAAALLICSAIWPSRALRLAALWCATAAALARAAVLVLNAPVIDPQRTAAGVVVWLMFAYLVTMLTLLSELSAGPRGSEWSS